MTVDNDPFIANGVAALDAVLRDDEPGASAIMAEMTPVQLHELMRVCLVTTGLARDTILGSADELGSDDWTVRYAHQAVEAMKESDS